MAQRQRLADLIKSFSTSTPESLVDPRVQCWSTQAGLFGKLPGEVVVVIFKEILRLSSDLTCGVELRQHTVDSIDGVAGLLRSCRFVRWSFGIFGQELKLEFAARQLTHRTPTNPTSPVPYFDQLLSEERSKLDIGVFESALNSMLTHCAGEHCRAARRLFNSTPAPTARSSMPLLEAVLKNQRPTAKVVWPSSVNKIAVSSASETAVLSVGTEDNTTLLTFKNEPSNVFNANTDLNFKQRVEVPVENLQGHVDRIAISPCGRYTAVTKRTSDSRGRTNGSLVVFDEERKLGEIFYKNLYVRTVWFRPVAVGSPPNVCFLLWNVGVEDSTYFHDDFEYSFEWKSNGIYQYTLDGGFQNACEQSLEGVRVQRILDFDSHSDLQALRPTTAITNWPDSHPKWESVAPRVFGRSAVLDVSIAASGSCVAAVVCGRSVLDSGYTFRCAQVVFYECPLAPPLNLFETLEGAPLDRARMHNHDVVAISNHYVECLDMPWRVKTVDLSPCGDTAVVFQQARNSELFVLVYLRLSPKSGFTMVRNIRLESAIQDPLVAIPWTIRTLPTSRSFSPCGRYLLVAFGDESTGLAALRNKTGVCILDVCDTEAYASPQTLAFLECRKELVPEEMHWRSSGLWLLQRRGVLLLGI